MAALSLQLMLLAGAYAQEPYPTRTIRLVVPSSPSGGTDASARIISPKLSALLGQQIVLDYRPGAAAMIGTEASRARRRLLQSADCAEHHDHRALRLPQDTLRPVKDFAPISQVAVVPLLMVGHPHCPRARQGAGRVGEVPSGPARLRGRRIRRQFASGNGSIF